ncbi:phospho-N-acetylmuramoyl-pentapeptide-transferase [Arcanobacterium haemolyticum]|uniref:Phospho-N-acetylmuramoyl-pentapeptide-transferase n=1 Tax=Arcanobacterium haemolyticum (strain ATCC 9345 / DSM 20595 / CCM 5947 / CCUG 17215 / LMG 16163 / NBRC 15585 / NCTC 8452 / 11018) TaxID=644284 RepID=D7BNA6_ARCHD|nr:phospho-N-acetylmuramoyl-pentapeptide-transferase [Arcanobacterium haemolyticum]ADH92405.1 phospho-N-acetylmuramoyl-pentapeptide-transferase [Arcanobacterium haemolyticum DSM 20595]QCX46540.1 phospho-N-acetylmuramoyl-pentapeptide-transferase [Arcanobacterium haemolyticum]SQH28867.1 Phospho-N-acetylmuramoyl-pentapeptide-transferase [Arcanobacterium haemolyticum]
MLAILIALGTALIIALLGTPFFIKVLEKRSYGQFIREDGPTTHLVKRGTPTMGGVVIIAATIIGWAVANLTTQRVPQISGFLLLGLMMGMGMVGFLDDFTKVRKERSLGLTPRAKMIGLGTVGIVFSLLALQFPNDINRTPGSTAISAVRDLPVDFSYLGYGVGIVLFVLWANFLISAWSNGVNLTDGLDGLAAGASMLAFGAYTIVGIWQYYQSCESVVAASPGCYDVRDPREIAIICAAIVGACFGFLWHNTSPAAIFMGDTGSLALGGAFAGVSILTRTEILAVLLGGLFVVIVISDVIQIGMFKLTGKRVFRMAPLHHHFELKGWKEVTIVVRFWLIQGLFISAGMFLFYAEWLAQQ